MIDANEVDRVFRVCLFADGEDTTQHIVAEGITQNIGFNPGRIREHQSVISAWLDDLPEQFQEKGGGGWSFLNACNTKDGEQWTGLHQRMEQLFQLGIAIGRVKSQLPREMWNILPGGMPYYVVLSTQEVAQ